MTESSCTCGRVWACILPQPPCPEHGRGFTPNAETLAAISDSYSGRVETHESVAALIASFGITRD